MTSESDVYIRQILTAKVDPRAGRVNIFIMVVDPYNIRFKMNQKELDKTFMMILN